MWGPRWNLLLALPEAYNVDFVSPNVSCSALQQGLSIQPQSLPAPPPAHPQLWFLGFLIHRRTWSDLEAGTRRLTPGDLLAVMDADGCSSVVTAD